MAGIAVLIAAGLLYLWLSRSRDAVLIRAAEVSRQNLISVVTANGKVEPLVDFQAHAPVASVIEQLPVHLGQQVTKGQELVQLDARDAQSRIAAAQATLDSANLALRNMQAGGTTDELLAQRADLQAAQTQQAAAQHSLDLLQALQAKGAASPNEVAAAQGRLADSRARVAQLEARTHGRYSTADLQTQGAQVAEARAALLAARSGYAGLDIRSPIAGTVYSLPYARYDFVPAGDALINVADLHHLQVRAYFDEPEIGKLRLGESVRVTWDARPNREWHGRVTQPPTSIITYNGTRNVGACLISIEDVDGELIPNINVTVTVTYSQHFGVLSMPREALRASGGRSFVFKIAGDRLVRTPVELGDVNLTRAEIRSGLAPGDMVALGALSDTDLSDGLRVRVQTAGATQ